MRADFIKAHRAALTDFFADMIRALRWFLDPADHKEAMDIAETVTKQAPKAVDYIFTREDSYRSPDALPNIASIQTGIDSDVKLGVIPHRVTISPKYVDLSPVEEAKRRVDGE